MQIIYTIFQLLRFYFHNLLLLNIKQLIIIVIRFVALKQTRIILKNSFSNFHLTITLHLLNLKLISFDVPNIYFNYYKE
jgi:hypothetical protein